MTKNINFDAENDDTEGHMKVADEAPSVRIAAHEEDDTKGHVRAMDEAPSVRIAAHDDEDDTEGHVMRFGEAPSLRIADEAPGISGSLSVDPKSQA